MIDYHVHPDFSHDAEGSIDDFCARAVEIGLEEICFTSHYEPDPARSSVERVRVNGRMQMVYSDWPEAYFAAIEVARTRFPGLVVLAGVEVGYDPSLVGIIGDFLSRYPFDFALGAVHSLDSVCLTGGDELERFKGEFLPQGPEKVAEHYFHNVRSAAGSRLFDSLAHLDVYRKYVRPLFDDRFSRAADSLLPSVLKFVAESGTGIEVNASALRRGNAEPYPEKRIVKLAKESGVRVFTVGSDCHRPADLGKGLDTAVQVLSDLDIEPARFRGRKLVAAGCRQLRAGSCPRARMIGGLSEGGTRPG